jgi:DNA repair protein RadC
MEKERTNTSIRHWSVDDKPREKLMLKGNQALSDAELLAILIGSGSRNETAVDLSKRILFDQQNNLNQLARLSLSDLQKFKGIGEAKAITIMAALELGKRRRLEEALELPKVTDSRTVYELLQPLMGDLNHEEFWIVYLNQSNKIVGKWLASKGGITSTMVDVRLVLKKALELMATGLILSHNHPSGKREPSQSDKDLTRKMIDAAKVMDIQVLDHLIVTEKSYFSFADEGIL